MLEATIIRGLLSREDNFPAVADIVSPANFVSPAAAHVFSLISEMYGKANINLQTVILKTDMAYREWVVETAAGVPGDIIHAAGEVALRSKRRRIALELAGLAAQAENSINDIEWVLEDLMKVYQEAMGPDKKNADISSVLGRFAAEQQHNHDNGMGKMTGFKDLDDDYITYRPGMLMVVGAWTSVGKTAWCVEAIVRLMRNGGAKMVIFSTEMTEGQNIARILANLTAINANVILSGRMLDKHHKQVEAEKEYIKGQSLTIYDNVRNVKDIATKARKLYHGTGIDVIYIDFIQNLFLPGYKSKYEMMSNIAIELQNLAHDLRCTIVCLSQIPNTAGKEDSGILEFKGAGEIAAACDVGILMKLAKEDKKVVLFDVRKNRHGPCKSYAMRFVDGWTRLEDFFIPGN